MRLINAALSRLHQGQKGQALLYLAVMFTVLLGFTAMVVDAGVVYWNRRMLQNAVDGAVLAGAAKLPNDTTAAIQSAGAYAQSNGVSTSELLCDTTSAAILGCPVDTTTPNYDIRVISNYNANDTIVVSARRRITFGLRYIIGAGDTDVAATAAAIVAPTNPTSGLLPWGVTQDSLTKCGTSACTLYYCPPNQSCPNPGPSGGNFGPVDFQAGSSGGGNCSAGGGGQTYGSNILYGYNGPVPSPTPGATPTWSWQICTQTGADVGNTFGQGNNPASSGGVQELFYWDSQQWCDGGVPCSGLYGPPPPPASYWGTIYNGEVCGPGSTGNPPTNWPTTCARLGIVPVIQSWPKSGNQPITVVSFACFYLTNYDKQNKTIQGVFLKSCTDVGGDQPVLGGTLNGPLSTFLWR